MKLQVMQLDSNVKMFDPSVYPLEHILGGIFCVQVYHGA